MIDEKRDRDVLGRSGKPTDSEGERQKEVKISRWE